MNEHTVGNLSASMTYRSEMASGTVFPITVLIMGASGIIAQLLLLRELLITFLSNELTIGIILSNWLLLEAAGSWIGRFIERSRRKVRLFLIVTCIFSVSLPFSVYFARTCKTISGAGPGEGMGLDLIFLFSLLILLPVCVTHGALFTFACRLMPAPSRAGAKGIGKVYFLETLGTIAGGLLFTLLMTTLLNSFTASFTVFFFNFSACIIILAHKNRMAENSRFPNGRISIFRCKIPALYAFFPLVIVFLVMLGSAPGIQRRSIEKQWQGQRVVNYQNSFYGNTTIIGGDGEYTYFTDGVPSITTPMPDTVFVEEFAHLPLLFNPQPEYILVISGGVGGVINELLKHSIKRIDYVELDPFLLKLVRKFPTDLTEAELNDPRVRVFYEDGRSFLRKARNRYDVILLGLSDPHDLQVNRFFTEQFFSIARSKLREDGIIALTLPGSLTYLGDELKDLNASILNTLKDVFPGVRVIPADGYNLFMASPSTESTFYDAEDVRERLIRAGLDLRYLGSSSINYRLNPDLARWFSESMIGADARRNEDFRPAAVFYSLSYWNAKFSPQFRALLKLGGKLNLTVLTGAILLSAILFLVPVSGSAKPFRFSIPLAVSATGLTGMVLEIAIIFAFQSLYGVVFYWMGLLITAFMTGVAAGSLLMTRYMDRIRSDVPWFMGTEGALAAFSFILPLVILGSESFMGNFGGIAVVQILFLAFSLLAGFLIGVQFPLAGKIYLSSTGNVGGAGGLLYGTDLLGGWFGGITGGVFLLPLLGLFNTCLFLGILKLSSLILVASGGWRKGSTEDEGRRSW